MFEFGGLLRYHFSKGKFVLADMNIVIPGSVGYFLVKNGAITEAQLQQAL